MTNAQKKRDRRATRVRGGPGNPGEPVSGEDARARTDADTIKGTRASRSARLDWIVARMSTIPSGWTEAARLEAMALFDVTRNTVERDAAEASRTIERQATDPQLRERLESMLEMASDELRALATDTFIMARERVAALRELRETAATWAALRGVAAPKTVNIGGTLVDFLSLGSAPPEGE